MDEIPKFNKNIATLKEHWDHCLEMMVIARNAPTARVLAELALAEYFGRIDEHATYLELMKKDAI